MDHCLLGSSVHKILQARILGWVAMPSSRGIFPTQGSNLHLLCLLGWQGSSSPLKSSVSVIWLHNKSNLVAYNDRSQFFSSDRFGKKYSSLLHKHHLGWPGWGWELSSKKTVHSDIAGKLTLAAVGRDLGSLSCSLSPWLGWAPHNWGFLGSERECHNRKHS